MPKFSKTIKEQQNLDSLYFGTGVGKNSIDADDFKFQSNKKANSDIPSLTQDKQFLVALFLYQTNPIAHRFIETLVAFTMGDGPVPVALDESVQEVLDEFWFNSHNDWPERSLQFARDLSIYGEQTYAFGEVTEGSNILGMQFVNPRDIFRIVPNSKDRYTMDTVILDKKAVPGITDQNDPKLRLSVVRQNESGRSVGDVFFQKINQTGDATRGLSDLFPLVDWLQLYNQTQFNLGTRLEHQGMYLIDVEIENATDEELAKFEQKFLLQPPKPGSIVAHNSRAKLDFKSTNLDSGGLKEIGDSFFSTIMTGLGYPIHWTGLGSQGGRSAAESANDPVLRGFSMRQGVYNKFLSKIAKLQIDIAAETNMIGKNVSEEFKFLFPKLGIRDFQRAGATTARIARALKDSVDAGLIDKATANSLLMLSFEQVGLKADKFSKSMDISKSTTEESIRLRTSLSLMESHIDEILEDRRYPTDKEKVQAKSLLNKIIIYHGTD